MSFCRFCGLQLPDDALFCVRCGRPLGITASQAPYPVHPGNTGSPQPINSPPTKPIDEREEERRRRMAPGIPLSEQPAAGGSVPAVQGAPQIGTVPSVSVPAAAGTTASVLTAGTLAKVIVIAATCAAVIFTGIKVVPIIISHPVTPTPTPIPVTVKMPPTQTSCPLGGAARAAVMANLVLGKDQNVVYADNLQQSSGTPTPTSGTLERYDTKTGIATPIVKLANTNITEAQVSSNGEWVLFVASVNGHSAIQMIRMDNQGLQTLYCSSSTTNVISNPLWSPDGKSLAFEEGTPDTSFHYQTPTIYLLQMGSGKLQTELIQPQSVDPKTDISGYGIRAWFDNKRLYVVGTIQPTQDNGPLPINIYLLDTSKGANQSWQNLQQVYSINDEFWTFETSPDGSQLVISDCKGCTFGGFLNASGAPSLIIVMSISKTGVAGPPHTIFSNSADMLEDFRIISNTTMLFIISNDTYRNGTADTTRNGVWEINLDGSHMVHLTNDGASNSSKFCNLSCFYDTDKKLVWSNISRDSTMYALIIQSNNYNTMTLEVDPLSEGKAISVASVTSSGLTTYESFTVVGWTTM